MIGGAVWQNGGINGPGRIRRRRPRRHRRTALVEALWEKASEAAARAADPTLPRATRARYEGMANGIITALDAFDEVTAPDGGQRPTPA